MASADSPERDPLSPEEILPELTDEEEDDDRDRSSDHELDGEEEGGFNDLLEDKSPPGDSAGPLLGSGEHSPQVSNNKHSPKSFPEDQAVSGSNLAPLQDSPDSPPVEKSNLDIVERNQDDCEEHEGRSVRSPHPSEDEDHLSEIRSPGSESEPNQDVRRSPNVDDEDHERANDLHDEASSVTRELDEHELDYDEEVPEEPVGPNPEDDQEKLMGDDEDEKDKEGSPLNEKTESQKDEDPKDKKKEDDDGEIDEGEIDDDDLEEGEVKDPNDRKTRPRLTCRFFMKGNCTWGMSCRFIHPGMNDKGNYSLITKPDPFSPNGTPAGVAPLAPNIWGAPATEELLLPPVQDPPTESAWERGLRHAKEVLKKATIRKEQEPDFEEKRLTVTIGEDERDFDKENDYLHDWNYRITREVRETGEVEFRETVSHGPDPFADPYHDLEMERYWRGGQYENFRVQYTETEPYRYRDRERERDRDRDRDRQRDKERDRERDRDRERRQRERERDREREREKDRQKRKDEWERDRSKRDEKERQKEKEKEKEKTRTKSPLLPSRPNEASKKDPPAVSLPAANPSVSAVTPNLSGPPTIKRADEWKDPWRRSKSPKKKSGNSGSPSRGRRRRRTSGSSDSGSNSSRSSSRSSSYSGSGSSRSRSSSYSSYSSRSSRHSSFSGSHSRSRSFSSSPSPSPTPSPQKAATKPKGEPAPASAKGEKLNVKKVPAPTLAAPTAATAATTVKPPKVGPEAVKTGDKRISRAKETKRKAPPRRRTVSGSSYSGSSSRSGSRSLSRSSRSSSASLSPSPSASRKSRKSRSLSVSSVSSSSSSVRSADSDDMYADLASPISSASSRSPTPSQMKKDKASEKTKKDDQRPKEDKRPRDPTAAPPPPKPVPAKLPKPISGSKPALQPPAPPQAPSGFSAHKEIKLTLLSKSADKGSRKRYEPSDKDRPGSPPAKKANVSPERAVRDRKQPGKPPSPKADRQRVSNPKPSPIQPDRKRPASPPMKSSSKVTSIPGKAPEAAPSASATKTGKASTLSRREELLKQLKAVEDAIARKRAKIPGKV